MNDELILIESQIEGPLVRLSKTGLAFDPAISFEKWVEVGRRLGDTQKLLAFWIGDWISFGRSKWEQGKYLNAELEFCKKYGTLANAVYVSQRIEPSRRRENLSFSHHREVAKFDEEKQEHYLNYAEANNISTRRLRRYIKEQEGEEVEDSSSEEENRAEILWKIRSYFKMPSYDDPYSSLEESGIIGDMLLDRLRVISYFTKEKKDKDLRKKLRASSYPIYSVKISSLIDEIALDLEKVIDEHEIVPDSLKKGIG